MSRSSTCKLVVYCEGRVFVPVQHQIFLSCFDYSKYLRFVQKHAVRCTPILTKVTIVFISGV